MKRTLPEIEFASCSHVGRRDNNEDACCVEPELGLFAVADGMGGYEGGEIASGLVVETLRGFYARNAADADVTWPFGLSASMTFDENMLHVATRLAHLAVCERKAGRLSRMGSTVAAVALLGDELVVGHVGDSRVYRLRGGELTQLTRDHSFVEEMKRRGMELPAGLYAHVVTRGIGMEGTAEPEVRTVAVEPGDVYLLCSDGLTDPLEPGDIAKRLVLEPTDACAALVDRAYEAGGSDNITAVVVRIPGGAGRAG